MKNIVLKIAYDGSSFLGWQKTKMGPSVEELLTDQLEKILAEKIQLQAASRTDAGVHADGQIVNFFITKEFSLSQLIKSLNSLLPKSIIVLRAYVAPFDFHPTTHALKKTYIYKISEGPIQNPFERFFSWHVPYFLDHERIREAFPLFLGEHDFSSFCNFRKNLRYENKRRTLYDLQLVKKENQLKFEITGDHFLYKMVRNIVGTLVYVGRKKIAVQKIPEIFSLKKRRYAGVTAPALGLSLHHIYYKEDFLL